MRSKTALLLILALAGGAVALDLDRARRERPRGVFRAPSADELDRTRDLFAATFRTARPGPDLHRSFADLGFRLEEHDGRRAGSRIVVISEAEERAEGRGFYAVRLDGATLPVLIQAPHSFHDLHTGEIAARLFQETSVAAAAWNTVHRRGGAPRGGPETGADLAHRDATTFQSFLHAFTDVYPDGRVVQLHGFARDKRRTPAGRDAVAILSDGTRSPPPRLAALQRCLAPVLGDGVALFPRDVDELGATTNAQARWIRTAGRGEFIHVELSRDVRERLREAASTRAAFARCLTEDGP